MSRKVRSSSSLPLNLVPRNVEGPPVEFPASHRSYIPFGRRDHRDWCLRDEGLLTG